MNRLLILWEEMETLSRRLNDDYLRMKQWKLTRLHEACPTRRLTRRYSTKEAVLALARVKEREAIEREQEASRTRDPMRKASVGATVNEGASPPRLPSINEKLLFPTENGPEKEKAKLALLPRSRSPIGQAGGRQGATPERARSSA